MLGSQRYYRINGGFSLRGEIEVAGAKNALSKQLVASLLTVEPCIFSNVPKITEVDRVLEMLVEIGSKYQWLDNQTLRIETPEILNTRINPRFQRYNRLPILLLGPLIHRAGTAGWNSARQSGKQGRLPQSRASGKDGGDRGQESRKGAQRKDGRGQEQGQGRRKPGCD